MGMQYDVLSSAVISADGPLQEITATDDLGRIRIKAVFGTLDQAGTVMFYDGVANTDPKILEIPIPDATAQGTFWLPLPGEGVLAENGVYVELGGADSLVVMYG